MLASILQIIGLIGVTVGVFLVAGLGFAVLSGSVATLAVGFQMERVSLRPRSEGR
jgi:hypothetical protein